MKKLLVFPFLLFIGVAIYKLNIVASLDTAYPHLQELKDGSRPSISFFVKRPKSWTNIEEISPMVKGAIIVSEDWAFYQHTGIDFSQIQNVLKNFLFTGKLKRGASTITQQLAKNLFLSPEKTFIRKGLELFYTLALETFLTKDRILELYLNVIEFDEDIYGITKASRYYFQQSPKYLTARKAAFLAMLLPNPKRYSVSFHKGELTVYARERIVTILNFMKIGKWIDAEQKKQALRERFSWEDNKAGSSL